MSSSHKAFAVAIVFLSWVPGLASCALSQQEEYPWVYYFRRPEMPQIHCAFADAEGNVIVATGDWENRHPGPPGYTWYEYWSEGMFRIREGDIEKIQCPDNTCVIDCATDSTGTTWVLFYEGEDYLVPGSKGCPTVPSSLCRGPSRIVSDRRFARFDGRSITVDAELTASIPKEPVVMVSDPRGRIFVISFREVDSTTREYFVSWWAADEPGLVHIKQAPDVLQHVILQYKPRFGPDGLVYFLASDTREECYAHTPAGVLALDPEAEEWHVYSGAETDIYCVYIDALNTKWFGTGNGLVRFDGDTWSRYTPQNSNLAFNLVRSIAYDAVDSVYYVISQDCVNGQYPTALSYLGSDGEFLSSSAYFGSISYWKLYAPMLVQDDRQTWWFEPYDSYTLYSYDHERVMMWDCRDWLDTSVGGVAHVGSTATGRRFAVTATCVMIW